MKNSLHKLTLLTSFLFLMCVQGYTQDIKAAFEKSKTDDTEEPTLLHQDCDHDHDEHVFQAQNNITSVLFSREDLDEMPEVRDVLLIQQSLIDNLGQDYIEQAYRDGQMFFEDAIYNSGDMYGIQEVTNLLDTTATAPEMFNLVGVIPLPDNLFGTGGNTGNLLNQFTNPNDGNFDQRSPDSLGTKYNQARYSVIVANETVNTSGTAGTLAAVLRRSAVDPTVGVNGTHIQAHEDVHRFYGQHSAAIQLTEDAIVGGVTIAEAGDWSLENGVGLYQPFLSEAGLDTIMNSTNGRGMVDATNYHPGLTIEAESQVATAFAGDFIVCDTDIHSSWANVDGLEVTIKGPDGETLQTGIHDNMEAEWGIQIPQDAESGPWTYTVEIHNSHTNETATNNVTITIEEDVVVNLDFDNDGITDAAEGTGDPDGDGVENRADSDSDGDGVPDNIEGHDANEDGIADVVASGTDSNNNGLDDAFDPEVGGIEAPRQDSDGDGNPDVTDIDDDDDGIKTQVELLSSTNKDGDEKPNYLDLDSDDDLVPDDIEGHDANEDGIADVAASGIDSNNNGLDDAFDPEAGGMAATLPDTDANNEKNIEDNDDDGDGILTKDELGDNNNNSVPDYLEYTTVSTNELNPNNQALKIFPNPTSGAIGFTMELPQSFLGDDVLTTIIDARGRIVFQVDEMASGSNAVQIPFNPQQSGVYFISVNNGNQIKRAKVIYR